MNYFKHVQRGRRALSILQLTLKFKWNGPLGAIVAFLLDHDFRKAAVCALIGAVFAFFGIIHGTLGIGTAPLHGAGYLFLAVVILYFMARRKSGWETVARTPPAAAQNVHQQHPEIGGHS
uniref:Uncharacterized protein n=1 Tax=Candidatus Kentrum sp. FM TaxID=2126340 RepID=A0A450VYH2_9GAMM|nr:MAG: hypothetical protein BECKFM1743B_GA0114221_1011310 [Candidatus Kentron sp. FM]